jgi:protein-disulfide isomerase
MHDGVASRAFPLSVLCFWLVTLGCGQAQSPATAAAQSGSVPDPVATVNGEPITRDDLETVVAPQIAKLDAEAYQIRRTHLDELIAARLIAAEAATRNLTPEQLLQAEVDDRVPAVTTADIAKFVEANRARLPPDTAAIEPQIRAFLEEQRYNARRAEFLESLKGKAQVAVHLAAPPVFRATINSEGAPSLGPESAPVTIVEFSDFHCPFCRSVQPTLEQLLARYPKDVRLVYKHFPLDSLHPEARRAAEASWCAQQQDKFWPYHDRLYAIGPDGSDTTLTTVARETGLDLTAFQQCLGGNEAADVVNADVSEGVRFGISGTPGFFINGRFMSGAQPLDAFVRIIDEELGR